MRNPFELTSRLIPQIGMNIRFQATKDILEAKSRKNTINAQIFGVATFAAPSVTSLYIDKRRLSGARLLLPLAACGVFTMYSCHRFAVSLCYFMYAPTDAYDYLDMVERNKLGGR